MDTSLFTDIGFTESEIKVYFALLEHAPATVGPIIKSSKVPDSKIYQLLDRLVQKGLASFVIKNNVKWYQACAPQNLLRYIHDKKGKLEQQEEIIKTVVIPEIEQRRLLVKEQQESLVFESLQGVRSAFEYILQHVPKGEEYQVIAFGEDLSNKAVMQFFLQHHARRKAAGVRVRLLGHEKYRTIISKNLNSKYMRMRFTDIQIPLGTYIFPGHIMNLVWDPMPTAFIIKSNAVYQRYLEFFNGVWNNAKPL